MLSLTFGVLCAVGFGMVWWRGGRHRRWRRFPVRRLRRWLSTRPEQDGVLEQEWGRLGDELRTLRRELKQVQGTALQAFGAETFDRQALDAWHDKVRNQADRFYESAAAALERIHATLDANQRQKLRARLQWRHRAGAFQGEAS